MVASYRVGWVPCNPGLFQNKLFDLTMARDNAVERFVVANHLLQAEGFRSNTIDLWRGSKVDAVIFYSLASDLGWLVRAIKANPKVRLINIPIEPPIVAPLHDENLLAGLPFDRILVWNDALANRGAPFVKANIGEPRIVLESIPNVAFNQKKFLVAIYSRKLLRHEYGLYEYRHQALKFFSNTPEKLDLYGMGWENMEKGPLAKCYKGRCESKKAILKNYKFAICFENAKHDGLITEKIFDCFGAGTVPIYYGAPNVTSYIPRSCFIDFRNFNDYTSLYNFLVDLKEDEYQAYLDAISGFVRSQQYRQFTSLHYAQVILSQVQELRGLPAKPRTIFKFKWTLLRGLICDPWKFLKGVMRCRRFLWDLFFVW